MAANSEHWDTSIQHSARTDMGMRRTNNQDSYCVRMASDPQRYSRKGHLFLVADGMGAHAAGELASKLAADNVPHLYQKYADKPAADALKLAIHEANSEIHRRGQANADFHNMGTTCSAMALLPQGAVIAHVGDSRIYRLRDGALEQLTFDHSLVWEMRAAGQFKEGSEAASRVPKNVITRSLGPNAAVEIDIEGPFPVESGDVYLLCSDGLTGPVADEELGPIIQHIEPAAATQLLIDLANLRGGPDNITVIVARVDGANGHADAKMHRGASAGPGSAAITSWIVLGVCVLAAAGMAATKMWALAAVLGLAAVAALVAALWLTFAKGGPSLSQSRKEGGAPYTRTSAQGVGQVCKGLDELVSQLETAARDEQWAVDLERLKQLRTQARQSLESDKPVEGLKGYAQTVSFIMEELRNQRKKRASDSTIDL